MEVRGWDLLDLGGLDKKVLGRRCVRDKDCRFELLGMENLSINEV